MQIYRAQTSLCINRNSDGQAQWEADRSQSRGLPWLVTLQRLLGWRIQARDRTVTAHARCIIISIVTSLWLDLLHPLLYLHFAISHWYWCFWRCNMWFKCRQKDCITERHQQFGTQGPNQPYLTTCTSRRFVCPWCAATQQSCCGVCMVDGNVADWMQETGLYPNCSHPLMKTYPICNFIVKFDLIHSLQVLRC